MSRSCNSRLEALADALGVGLMSLNNDGEVEFASGELRQLLSGEGEWGFDSRSVLQTSIGAALQQLRAGDCATAHVDFELATAAQPRSLQLEMRALPVDGEIAYVAFVRDRGNREALDRDLYNASCFKSLPALYVGAAHDLRGPLNNIAVMLELLKQSLGPSDAQPSVQRQQEYCQRVQGEIKRLNHQLQALLDLADPPAADVEAEHDATRILQELADLIRGKARLQQVDIEWCAPQQPAFVRCRRAQLRQALLNVVINALEAMPDGGILKLKLTRHADSLLIDICDTGAGIPRAIEQQVFALHFGTKEAGTGLGLYVARTTINSLGGTIDVARDYPDETCLRVSLPAVPGEAASVLSYRDERQDNA